MHSISQIPRQDQWGELSDLSCQSEHWVFLDEFIHKTRHMWMQFNVFDLFCLQTHKFIQIKHIWTSFITENVQVKPPTFRNIPIRKWRPTVVNNTGHFRCKHALRNICSDENNFRLRMLVNSYSYPKIFRSNFIIWPPLKPAHQKTYSTVTLTLMPAVYCTM